MEVGIPVDNLMQGIAYRPYAGQSDQLARDNEPIRPPNYELVTQHRHEVIVGRADVCRQGRDSHTVPDRLVVTSDVIGLDLRPPGGQYPVEDTQRFDIQERVHIPDERVMT